VPVPEITHLDPDGMPPTLVQRKVGECLPDGVVREVKAEDMVEPGTGRLPLQQEEALFEMLQKLHRNDVFWEDIQVANVFLQQLRRPDGSTYWRAGIIDTDRIGSFSRPRHGRQPDLWIRLLQNRPQEYNVFSRPSGRPFRDAEEAMLAALEHRKFLLYNAQAGMLIPVRVRPVTLQKYFPSYSKFPTGGAGSGSPSSLFGPHLLRDATRARLPSGLRWPGARLLPVAA
jgi:hypothetical protein